VGSVCCDMITGNGGSGTKCQPRRRSVSDGSDELEEHDEHESERVDTSVCTA
jgi:hypothetical protein